MKAKILEKIYNQIEERIGHVEKEYDVECARIAIDVFDKLTSDEKWAVYEEIREIAPLSGTNSFYYGSAAIVANLIQFYVETWQQKNAN